MGRPDASPQKAPPVALVTPYTPPLLKASLGAFIHSVETCELGSLYSRKSTSIHRMENFKVVCLSSNLQS